MDHTTTDDWRTDVAPVTGFEERAPGWREAYIPKKSSVADLCSDDPGRLLVSHAHASADRRNVETFIRREFREHFDARITHFMPVLVGLHDGRRSILAAAGCRNAGDERLFLEAYLDTPIEQAIAERFGADVPRDEIVEVGGLACRNGRPAIAMIQALVPYLLEAKFKWVVFTGADTVVRVFQRLHLFPQRLCRADKSRLDYDQQRAWGRYYDHDPHVMAGRLLEGIRLLSLAVDAP
jgi:hypothetical protein